MTAIYTNGPGNYHQVTASGLASNTTYYFCAAWGAWDEVGNFYDYTGCGNTASATTYGPPAAPSNLGATPISGTQVNLSWSDGSGNETGFAIERKTGSGETYSQIATVGANVTSYSNTTGLSMGTTYYYRVRATNSYGASAYTAQAVATTYSLPDGVPGSLGAAATSDTQISLNWSDAISNEAGFKIERKTGIGGTYSQIQLTAANTTSFNDSGLSATTAYYYRVRATNQAGDSAYSNEIAATTLTPPNGTATGLSAAPIGANQVNLAWVDGVTNETGFKVERKTGAAGTWAQVGTTGADATAYSDTGLSSSTTYYYRVRATNTGGDAAYSNEASVKTDPVSSTAGSTLTFAYDSFGNLTQTNAGGVITTVTYDLRGRKVAMSDPDMGNWSYTYNALGELVSQTDAKNQTTTMQYDLLGRMTTRTEADLNSTWTYDACTKGVGKLCSASAGNDYQRTHAYDSLGRPSTLTVSVDTSYAATTTYDSAGRAETLTYPGGFATRNVYNSHGYLAEIRNNASNALIWQAQAMSASGRVTTALLGNGLTETRTYDVVDRLVSQSASGTGGTAQNNTYAYDAIGNLTQRADATQGVTEYFYYDSLNRLLASSGPGLVSRSYEYDAIGNMIYKSDVGTYTYGSKPHAVASVSGAVNATYTYDANGNLISGAGRTLAYASFNLPATVTQGTDSYQYTYDAEHMRVRLVATRASGTYTTIYVHPGGKNGALLYEKETFPDGKIEYRHYVADVGVYVTKSSYGAGDGPGMRYFHRDHLDSVQVITNEAGAQIERLAYEAYGKRRYPNGTADPSNALFGVTTERGFTGHEHLDEMQLVHMNGRIFDPLLGRFMTPDTFVQFAFSLQSYNRYAYVLNNPLGAVDPSGHLLGFLSDLADATIGKVGDEVGRFLDTKVGQLGVTVYFAWIFGGGGGRGFGNVIANGFSGGFAGSYYASDGHLGASLLGGITGGAFGSVRHLQGWQAVTAHAAIGCASGELSGGGCGPNALAAGFAKYATNELPPSIQRNPVVLGVAVTVIGGTASKLGGGKFANGAATAAYGYLFNACSKGGCWVTDEERALFREGRTVEGYRAMCTGGDAYACEAGKVAANDGLAANVTNARLETSLVAEGAARGRFAARGIMGSITVDLGNAYVDHLDSLGGSSSSPVWPSRSGIAQFHKDIFTTYGAANVFGGNVSDQAIVRRIWGYDWCKNCGR